MLAPAVETAVKAVRVFKEGRARAHERHTLTLSRAFDIVPRLIGESGKSG
jgi:hypothetical protein